MRHITLALLALASLQAEAKITITQTTCNYQKGLAVSKGDVRFGWQMTSDVNNDHQKAYQLIIKENITGRKVYDSGKKKSKDSQFISTPALTPNRHGYLWQVRVWDKSGKPSEWSQAQAIRIVGDEMDKSQWIGAITRKDARLPEGRFSNAEFKKDYFVEKWTPVDTLSSKSIILRKEFSNGGKAITDAVVYVSGMGHYEMLINGKKVGDSMFAPLCSEYSKTIYYNTYDVTSLLNKDGNAINVLLGNGFFNVQRGDRYSKLMTSFGAPQMTMRMEINYSDGTSKTIVSDGSWKYALSPVTFNSIYGGESYDARLVQDKACMPHFDDSAWKDAVLVEGAGGILEPQTAQPIKIMERFGIKTWNYLPADSVASASAKTKRTVSPHTFIADMGQNLAGFPEIKVKGRPGQKVTMLVSENLNKQGVCDQRQTGRQHYYEYTIGSDTVETWHPRFSYYGFRYIQVEDAVLEGEPNPEGLPVIVSLQSCFIYNSAEEGSSFECSNPIFTKTHRLIERAERSNMQSVMSDCPHREKLGWLEQDHLVGPSLFYNFDMTLFCPKIIRDITDTQKQDGMVPTTAPQYVSFGNLFDDSPEWGSTLIIMPFQYYEQYGDSTIITRNYNAMCRYVDYLTSRSKDGIVSHGLGDWYDVVEGGKSGFCHNTPIPLVATAHYIYDLKLMTCAARMVGNKTDETKYSTLYNKVVEAFNREFYKPDSCCYGTGSQTSNALPLFLGITGENKEKVLQSLIADIEKHGNRLTTGDVGNRYLFMALALNNKDELLYKMLNHYETPGYGFQIKQGATTLTEQWDPRQGSSWNHLMMGQIDEWFFKRLAGIQNMPGTNGMRHLLISPTLVGDMTSVKGSTTTLYGKVEVTFNDKGLYAKIPVGCDAEIVIGSSFRMKVGSGEHYFFFKKSGDTTSIFKMVDNKKKK